MQDSGSTEVEGDEARLDRACSERETLTFLLDGRGGTGAQDILSRGLLGVLNESGVQEKELTLAGSSLQLIR